MNTSKILIICGVAAFVLFAKESSAHQLMSLEQVAKHFASLIFLGEYCEAKYPHLKGNIDATWIEGWDEPTRKWAVDFIKSPQVLSELNKIRLETRQTEHEFAEQCLSMYGPDSDLERSRKQKADWAARVKNNSIQESVDARERQPQSPSCDCQTER